MSSLFFPNPDAVRLAVSAGVIPADVAGRPVVAGVDAGGGVWVVPPDGIAHSPRLARLNVRLLTPPRELDAAERPCWAALIPLRTDPQPPAQGPYLFDLPVGKLAKFVATVQRLNPQPVRFLIVEDRAVLRVDAPPHYLTLTAADVGAGVYRPAARGAWVRLGWEHPLPGPAGFDPHRVALLDPPTGWRRLPESPFTGTAPSHPLTVAPLPPPNPPARATIRVPLKVRRTRTAAVETLWLLPGGVPALAAFVADAEEKLVHLLEAAEVTTADGSRVILRPADGRKRTPVVPLSATPYAPLPGQPEVFLPVGFGLSPQPRPEAVGRAVEGRPGYLSLVEPDPAGIVVHRVPLSAFRPLKSFVAYSVPRKLAHAAHEPTPLFALPGFVAATPTVPKADPDFPPVPVRSRRPTAPPRLKRGTLFGRFAELFRGGKRGEELGNKAALKAPDPVDPPVTPSPPRTARARSDWAARRAALERQVVDAGHRLDPRSRGDQWAELAGLYGETGQSADAAVCWANAVWDRATPPAEWFDLWVRMEAKASGTDGDLMAIVARPPSASAARVAAALMVRASRQTPGTAFPWAEATALLDRFESDLPVRGVWLARLAASAAVGGDPLALARCRDRLFARLSVGGPALDVDAPTFLRFHGTAGGERFADARDWLLRARGSVRKWLEKTDNGGGLAEFGLAADFTATAAYADLMFAWGLMRLGDRTPARELEAAAARTLLGIARPDVNPEVHRRLLARFRALTRAADHGRPPVEVAEPPLSDCLSESVVARLPLHSRILDPAGGTHDFLGQDLKGLVHGDEFGARLIGLLSGVGDPNPPLRELLIEAVASRDGNRLPRAVLVGLDIASRLTPAVAAEVLHRLPAAMGWVPNLALLEIKARRWDFEARTHARLLLGATATALRFQLTEPMRGVAAHLATVLGGMETTIREGLAKAAAPLFRGLRKLGLKAESEAILKRAGDRTTGSPDDRLGFAVGWAAVGREAVAVRALDEARDRLFVRGIADVRDRTATAITYAVALGHVQPRLALGRLEELFQRLDRVTADGATARYYALKPLELIDAAVTAVVSDEFALGPQVRGWLDDDEFQLRKRITKQLAAAVG